jgi:hypothetical protein
MSAIISDAIRNHLSRKLLRKMAEQKLRQIRHHFCAILIFLSDSAVTDL